VCLPELEIFEAYMYVYQADKLVDKRKIPCLSDTLEPISTPPNHFGLEFSLKPKKITV
jgi:hypothetical protein